jgi:hypothetical protein
MSLELDIRFWWDEEINPAQGIASMLQVFEKWSGGEINWESANVRQHFPVNEIASLGAHPSASRLLEALKRHDSSDLKINVYGSFPCWRFSEGEPISGAIPVAIACWGKDYGKKMEDWDTSMQGHAQFCLLNSRPFFGVLHSDTQEFPFHDLNAKIQENLDSLLQLLQIFISDLHPLQWLAFSDDGSTYLPIHAHAGWFATQHQLLQVANIFMDILKRGDARNGIPPIASLSVPSLRDYLNSMLPKDRSMELFQRMKAIAAMQASANEGGLQRLLDSKKFDYFDYQSGLILLDFPFFLNAFLDEFFLALLEESNHR